MESLINPNVMPSFGIFGLSLWPILALKGQQMMPQKLLEPLNR